MAIESICEGCGNRLRVDDQYAGKAARCPHCRTVYTVPSIRSPDAPSELWRIQTETGDQYGPVSKQDLDQWVREGRVTAQSRVRREGTIDWQAAVTHYPQLAQAATTADGKNPFGERAAATTANNPYASPTQPSPTWGRPQRGGMVLTLGLVGLICCALAAPVAWILGHMDIKEMDAGRMDPSGRSLTQVGMVLGIIGTVIGVFLPGLFVVFGVLAEFG